MSRLSKITDWLILVFIFLLPWQTRWIYGVAKLNGLPWEYGTLSFFGTEILLWLIVILTGVRVFGSKNFWKKIASRAHLSRRWPALALGALIAVFAAYFYAVSPVREVSAQFISRLTGSICLMVCLAAANLSFRQMGLAFWGAGAVQGIIAIGQFLTQEIFANKWLGLAAHKATDIGAAVVQTSDERWLRSYGSFGWPNSLGIFLAVSFILGLVLFNFIGKKWRPFFLGGQMIILAGLLFTFSRGAWVAALIGVIVYFLIALFKKNRLVVNPALKQIVAGTLIVFTIVAIYFPLFNARANAIGYLENLSLCERASQYKIGEMVINNNFLFGVGPGLYTYYLAANFSPPAYGTYQPVHNIYLLSLAEFGLVVYVFFNILIIAAITFIWKKRPLFIAVIATVLIAGLFDHFLWSLYAGQALFWVVFGLGLAKKEDTLNEVKGEDIAP